MKKHLLLLTLMIVGLMACKKGPDPKAPKKLKSMTGTMEPVEGPYWGQKFVVDEEVYNENGELISSIKGNITRNRPEYYYPLAYTYKDRKLAETIDNYNVRSEYVYENGLLRQLNIYDGPKLGFKEVYEYDGQNRKVKMTSWNYRTYPSRYSPPPPVTPYTYTYEYNADNLLSKKIDEAGGVFTYEYDSHKNLSKVISNNTYTPGRTTIEETYDYQYDGTGRITQVVQQNFLSDAFKITISYDEDGRVKTKKIEQNFNGQFSVISNINYSYTYF